MTEQTTPRPITPEDYFKLQYITEACLSPDGKQVAYGVMRYDEKKDEDLTALWLLDLESGETRQITGGEQVDCSFDWSPDGKKIAFTSTRVEPAQIFVLPLDGGEAVQLTHSKTGVAEGPRWSPDGRFIAYTAPDPADEIDRSQPYRVTRHIYRFDRLGYLGEKLTDLYVIPAGGGEARRLTHDNCMSSKSWICAAR
ncbi:MAG: DPP IV N-terminal domain-containing protein [Anaerolineaceae bacterium]